MSITTALFFFITALIFAAGEIEIEGKYGWAEKLPTPYDTTSPLGRFYSLIMNKKPLTGYHSFMSFFIFMMFHIHFVFGADWSLVAELEVLAIWLAWTILEDFLWFILNPYYGLKNFRKEKIWWHAKSYWLFSLFPIDYLIGWGLSVLLIYIASQMSEEGRLLTNHLWLLVLFLLFTLVTIILIAPLYKHWYRTSRKHNDRDKVKIFHEE